MKYFENHPLIYREHPDGSVDKLNPYTRKWEPAGPAGKDELRRKLVVTGDAGEVPYDKIAHLTVSK